MAFAGIGGFTVSKLATEHGLGVPHRPVLGAVAATGDRPGRCAARASRVRGVNLAIVTFGRGRRRREPGVQEPGAVRRPDRRAGAAARLPRCQVRPERRSSFGDGKLPSPLFGIFCLMVVIALAPRRGQPPAVGDRTPVARGAHQRAGRRGRRHQRGAAPSCWRSPWRRSSPASPAHCRRTASARSRRRPSAASRRSASSPSPTSAASPASTGAMHRRACSWRTVLVFTALDSWFDVDPAFTALLGGIGLIVTAVVHNPKAWPERSAELRGSMAPIRRRSRPRPSGLPGSRSLDRRRR